MIALDATLVGDITAVLPEGRRCHNFTVPLLSCLPMRAAQQREISTQTLFDRYNVICPVSDRKDAVGLLLDAHS